MSGNTPARPPMRSYGRIKARPIKPRQAGLLESLLPTLALPDLTAGPLDVGALAQGRAEVWLEIGFGGGEHLAEQAARRPEVLVIGAEPFLNGAASLLRHIDERGLKNVRLHVGDAREILSALPDGSLDCVFVLFPDPWPKARHRKRRLITTETAAVLARVLKVGGRLRFATDWADYADQALLTLTRTPGLSWTAEQADDWRTSPADHVPTRYELKRLGDIAPVWFDFVRV